MFNDDEIGAVFLEFPRLNRSLDGLSTPIIRDMISSIKRTTNEIRCSHGRARVEDGPEGEAAEDANCGKFGGQRSRDDNFLLRYEVLSMGMTGCGKAPGNMGAGLDSTSAHPVDGDRHHAVDEAVATCTTDKKDNRIQQNEDIPIMVVQERGSELGGRADVEYEAL